MDTPKARRCYRFDHMWTGGPVCPECAKQNPRASARRERILLAAQLRGAARGLGAGWLWLEKAAALIEEDGK